MRIQWLPLGIMAVTLCLIACFACAEQVAVVVGCPLPLGSTEGQDSMQSLTLAKEEINAKGGILLNGKKVPIQLEIVDTDDLNPKVTKEEVTAKVESLIGEKKANVLIGGPARSEYGLAAMDIVAKHNVVHIVTAGCYTPQWNKVKYASDPKKYNKSFRMSGNIAWYIQEMKDLMTSLQKQYGFKKMFILVQDVMMCRDAAKNVKDVATQNGWEIVGEEAVPTETTDFSEPLKKCKASGAQVMFVWSFSPHTAELFEQWRNMEIPALPMGFIKAAEDPGFWKKTKGKCAYLVITLSEAGVTLSDVTPTSRAFYNAYEKRWGVPPRATGSAAGYEALFVLKDAIEQAGSYEPDKLIPALENVNLPVVRGRLRFDETHQCVFGYDPKTTILGNWAQWQNGKRVTIWPPSAKTGELIMPPWLQWFWLKTK